MQPLLLSPQLERQRFKTIRTRDDYGERRRSREETKHPMLAALGLLPTAEEYQQRAEDGHLAFQRRMRASEAEGWRRVRQWRDHASETEREIFRRHWRYLPHRFVYALDLNH